MGSGGLFGVIGDVAGFQIVAYDFVVEIYAVGGVAAVEPFIANAACLCHQAAGSESAAHRNPQSLRKRGTLHPLPELRLAGCHLFARIKLHIVYAPEEIERFFLAAHSLKRHERVLVGIIAQEQRSLLNGIDIAHVPAAVPQLFPCATVVEAYVHIIMVGEILKATHFEQLRMQIVPEIHIGGSLLGTHYKPFILMRLSGLVFIAGTHHHKSGLEAAVGKRILGVGL